ncbi:UPF0158 family protein [Lactiplantibacillus paraxiangfangensis]|uniref:UPF0158 family protein n=1 Tax=Lactiplantibacillus paraxiangfangensis TaxID=3076224 RepID=UPI0030C6DC1B
MKVKLDNVIEAVEMASDEVHYYYNKMTGEVTMVMAYEDDEDSDSDESETNLDQYLNLPSKYDVNDYHIMKAFIWQLPDGEQKVQLERSISGRGAFRYFRDQLADFGMTDQWYQFRDTTYRDIAIEWCQNNQIMFVEN